MRKPSSPSSPRVQINGTPALAVPRRILREVDRMNAAAYKAETHNKFMALVEASRKETA